MYHILREFLIYKKNHHWQQYYTKYQILNGELVKNQAVWTNKICWTIKLCEEFTEHVWDNMRSEI